MRLDARSSETRGGFGLTGELVPEHLTVVEPCNFPAKFPDPGLVLSYYRRGDTLIEAYWRSVAMPGQGLFIGEPLARPWPNGQGSGLRRNGAAGASSKRVR